jgi:hypothetical protein
MMLVVVLAMASLMHVLTVNYGSLLNIENVKREKGNNTIEY